MTPRRRSLAVAALMAALAACGGDEENQDGQRPAAGQTDDTSGATVVDMTDALKFEPSEITASVGDRVRWRNVGNIAHTVTTDPAKVADAGNVSVPSDVTPWDSGLIGADRSFARTFRRSGVYRYVCIPHEGARMIGSVVIER
jgi:plastocyanin